MIGDLNGDGVPEIIYGGESGILYGFSSNGTMSPGFPIRVGAEVRGTPTIADVDRDGDTDVILSGWDQQVYVWSFAGAFVRRNVPWGAFKGNMLRNGIYSYRAPTDAQDLSTSPPPRTMLYANIPNPFNPTTRILFDVGGDTGQRARLEIFDVRGRLVRSLVNRVLPPGRYSEVWDGRDGSGQASPSGVYFYRFETADHSASRKMILVR